MDLIDLTDNEITKKQDALMEQLPGLISKWARILNFPEEVIDEALVYQPNITPWLLCLVNNPEVIALGKILAACEEKGVHFDIKLISKEFNIPKEEIDTILIEFQNARRSYYLGRPRTSRRLLLVSPLLEMMNNDEEIKSTDDAVGLMRMYLEEVVKDITTCALKLARYYDRETIFVEDVRGALDPNNEILYPIQEKEEEIEVDLKGINSLIKKVKETQRKDP